MILVFVKPICLSLPLNEFSPPPATSAAPFVFLDHSDLPRTALQKKKKRRRRKKKEIAVTQPSREKLSTDKHGFPLLSIEFRDDQHNSEVTGGVSAGENFSHFSKKKKKKFFKRKTA